MTGPSGVYVGTAGWAIPRAIADAFPTEGTGLQRYAARFNATEVNSTFYRSHRPLTLERWRVTTPSRFRFAVKAPRALTHEAKLRDCEPRLVQFLEEIAALGEKLGPVLFQLPPSLAFTPTLAEAFFGALRARWTRPIACEPRHESWFTAEVDEVLKRYRVARVAADPIRAPQADRPGGDGALAYWRLHGSPRPYYSSYPSERLATLAHAIADGASAEAWCIFDNTASGAAAGNALELLRRLDPKLTPAGIEPP